MGFAGLRCWCSIGDWRLGVEVVRFLVDWVLLHFFVPVFWTRFTADDV